MSLELAADSAPGARLVVVTGDPEAGGGAPRPGDADDERREERLRRAVRTVADAGAAGVTILGAFVQPAIDGYEWHQGFDARLGLFDRDRSPRRALAALPVTRSEA